MLSDFITTEGPDILTIKKTLIAEGNKVKFIDVSSKAENIGIIDLDIDKSETKIFIKSHCAALKIRSQTDVFCRLETHC